MKYYAFFVIFEKAAKIILSSVYKLANYRWRLMGKYFVDCFSIAA